MKNVMSLVALTLGLAAVGGCTNKKDAAPAEGVVNGSVTELDFAPMPPAEPEMTYAAPFEPAPIDPATPAVPVLDAPAVTQAPAAGAAGSYTVKKGDTLFGIARQHYGNGGQWQRIANANPGLSPATLKAGTTIAIP